MAYTPRFVSQFDGGPLARANCTMAAGAMLLDKQTNGRIQTTGSDLRSRQYDQDRDGNAGTGFPQLASAFRSYGQPLDRVALPGIAALRSALQGGRGVVLIGNYGRFSPAYRLQSTFRGSHAIYLDHVVQRAGAVWYWRMDPIGRRGSYQGDYIPESEVRRFGWGAGWLGQAAQSKLDAAGGEGAQPPTSGIGAETEERTVALRSIALRLQVTGADGVARNALPTDLFTAGRANAWAQIVYELQGSGTNIDATASGYDNLASIRRAAEPYIGKMIGQLPEYVKVTVQKPTGDWVAQLAADLGKAFGEVGLKLLFVGLSVWLVYRGLNELTGTSAGLGAARLGPVSVPVVRVRV